MTDEQFLKKILSYLTYRMHECCKGHYGVGSVCTKCNVFHVCRSASLVEETEKRLKRLKEAKNDNRNE